MTEKYDVIVIGVGGMGSSTAFHLASRGLDTLGLEKFDIPHNMGSSHGVTRIIRKIQYEDPVYLPLVERAYDLWNELEEMTGRNIIQVTGGISAGPPDSRVYGKSLQCCEENNLTHEILSADEVNTRYPGYDLPDDHKAVYQPDAGFLVPEQAIIGHVEEAQSEGADIKARESVVDYITLPNGGVRVTTSKGIYEAERLVITAGAWTNKLLPQLREVVKPVRQVLAWLQPKRPNFFDPDEFPVFVHNTSEGEHYYGFPQYDVPGFKFGKFNHLHENVDPDKMARSPRRDDEIVLRDYARRYFPDGAGPTMKLSTCMFSNTPDENFILDTLPENPEIILGAGFSGHGFKFASVIGEILADLAENGETDFDLSPFQVDRF